MGCRLDEVSLQHDPVVDLPLLAWQDRLLGFVHGGLEWRFTDLNRNPLSHGLPEHGRGRQAESPVVASLTNWSTCKRNKCSLGTRVLVAPLFTG